MYLASVPTTARDNGGWVLLHLAELELASGGLALANDVAMSPSRSGFSEATFTIA